MLKLQRPLDSQFLQNENLRMCYGWHISPAVLARALENSASHARRVDTSAEECVPDVTTEPRKRTIKLFCKNHWFLQINHDGTVTGTRDQTTTLTNLQLLLVGRDLVQLFSVDTQQHLAMDSSGRLYATRNRTDGTIFKHVHEPNGFHTFASFKLSRDAPKEMFVAINRDGLPRNGARTFRLHKTSQFLII